MSKSRPSRVSRQNERRARPKTLAGPALQSVFAAWDRTDFTSGSSDPEVKVTFYDLGVTIASSPFANIDVPSA